jgi:hypothetical protein
LELELRNNRWKLGSADVLSYVLHLASIEQLEVHRMIEQSIVHLPELAKDIEQPVSIYLVHLSSPSRAWANLRLKCERYWHNGRCRAIGV